MNTAFEIVHGVHDSFRGCPVALAKITGKSEQWHRSHGYAPKTDNPLMSGNKSAVDDYLLMVRQYQAATPGAGRKLNNDVHRALDGEFADADLDVTTQAELHTDIIGQGCDVQTWLAQHDLEKATPSEHRHFQVECDEAIDALLAAKAQSVARMRRLQANGNGSLSPVRATALRGVK